MNVRTVFSSLKKNELKNFKKNSFLNALSGKYVTIYVVSDFIHFSFKNLENYSSLLKKKLEKKVQISNVLLDTIRGMEYSFPALKLIIESGGRVRYESIFLSLSDDDQNDDIYTRLPLLCVTKNAGIKLTKTIHASIEKMFNCSIRPCFVNSSELLWLTGIAINESIKMKINEGIDMAFCLPNYSKQCTIDIHLTEESLENIWLASRPEPMSNNLKKNEIESFFYGLLEHLKNTYGFNLEECTLQSVALCNIRYISGEKFQMFASSEDILYYILSLIQSDCVNRLSLC